MTAWEARSSERSRGYPSCSPIGVKLRRGKGEKKAGRKGSDSAAHL